MGRCLKGNSSKWPNQSPQARLALSNWLQPKQLLGLPERVMIELQNDGWILRNKIIWHKPNHMPSSVKDRLANTWEYIFHFVKSRRYYYDLDSIREPHKTGTPRADRDLERMRRGRAEFSGKRSGSGYQNSFVAGHPSGRNPGDVIEEPDGRGKLGSHRRIMRDCGYVNQHSGYMLAGLKLKSRQGVDIRNPKGKNPSDVIHGRPVRPPHHPYRGDGWEESALERGVVGNHPFGKNPGDVVQTKWSGIEGRWSGGFGSGGERSHWRDPAHYHSMGKNPGDIVQGESYRRKTAGLGKMLSMRNAPEPGEPHAYHGRGKNPGDVVCFYDAYWYGFLLAGAHSNRFYKKALHIMKEWMVKNECYDYSKFYEWYKKQVKGTWDSGNLDKGQCNYFSGGKALPFPKPETRFLGRNPGDVLKALPSGRTRQPSAAGQRSSRVGSSRDPGDFWTITTRPFPGAHFAVYPEELCVRPIKSSCPPGGIVLDMFAGSGTTCLAARKLGRRFIGIDINPTYVQLARTRLAHAQTVTPK